MCYNNRKLVLKLFFRKKFTPLAIFVLALGFYSLYSVAWDVLADVQTVSNIAIDPALDISRFAPYTIQADVSGTPSSVSANISGINQDGGSYWNYYADGTPASDSVTKAMTDMNSDGRWISSSVYPDNIYPEIFFAPSSITWNNVPSNTNVRRSNYHLMHFNNSLEMESSASFFIELNATPVSLVNSADLEVYLVEKGKAVTFFDSDWRNSASVELVGTIGRNVSYHHTHIDGKSSHYLVALETNANKTVGSKNLDISDDFWIIIYSNSPNNNRGWNLKYQNSALCDNTNSWYTGNQSGWSVAAQAGCPDAHIHMARRGTPSDGVMATVTANYADSDPVSTTQSIYFEPLPNLAPNPTNFTSPSSGAVYDGNEMQISWDTATDPNGDALTYNLYYYQGESVTPIATTLSSASFAWNISAVPDGSYGLKGEVCDNATPALCTPFYLPADFIINKIDEIYSLDEIAIASDNSVSTLARAGDVVALSFVASGDISSSLRVYFYSGGEVVEGVISKNSVANNWVASYVVSASDTEGTVDYLITADNLDFEYSESTILQIDNTSPEAVTSNPIAGNYDQSQSVSLNSIGSSQIRYTENGTNPSCSLGSLYENALSVSSPVLIKAIACDGAGNSSAVASLQYNFVYSFTYLAGSGGYISGFASQSVNRGANGSSVEAVPEFGYEFIDWSDGSVSNPRTDSNALANLSLTANFRALGGAVGVSLPPSVGSGKVDETVSMNSSSDIGNVDEKGVNVLGYIDSTIIFSTLNYSQKYNLKITELDLFNNTIKLSFSPNERVIELKEQGKSQIDLNGDGQNDLEVIFTNIYVNRAEITLHAISPSSPRENFDVTTPPVATVSKFIFQRNLRTGMINNDILELQKFLNSSGYGLATSGPGSPGQETAKFGLLTRKALIKFQKANKIYPSVGYFGPITRGFINSR